MFLPLRRSSTMESVIYPRFHLLGNANYGICMIRIWIKCASAYTSSVSMETLSDNL
jgi:hypothetical protein